ncbi:MAG: RraA family protein [Verrucomicrobia bacterium]|nr:RraA family protein [Verrucomicrobiota bacterium]
MNLKSLGFGLVIGALVTSSLHALTLTKDEMIALTAKWKGERYPDGRPKVPAALLERMKNVSIEEAWEVLKGDGYANQFDGGWQMIRADKPIVGRALTAVYMPNRPDLNERIYALGKEQGRIGGSNSWPIDMLQKGDVYVADGMGKIADGTLIGDNLGNAIHAKSGNGVVFDGSVRDLEGLEEIEGFNAFVRGWHPSAIKDMVLGGVNVPIRIGGVTVLPGDVVLAKREGVIFIPAHLAEKVVVTSEIVSLKDEFGHLRLREGVYTPGQIDRGWSKEIKEDFLKWFDAKPNKPPVSKDEIEKHL